MTSSSPPVGQPIPDIDDLHELLGRTGLPLEVTLVRGTEERTVTVQAPAAGEDPASRGDARQLAAAPADGPVAGPVARLAPGGLGGL